MTQTTKASKQFPIRSKNRHERMRGLLLSQPESDGLRQVPAGCRICPRHQFPLIDSHMQRPCCLPDGVFACLPAARERANAFFEINPSREGKAARWWVKHRLWDRPFWGAKLRQQGSPTIFGVWRSPTISRISTRYSRQSGLAGRFAVPEFIHLSARKP